jgi:4-hydroxymandelate oxidase
VQTPINVFDYESLAEQALSPMAWDYYRSGAHDERTLTRNRRAWDEVALHYRVMVDVSARSLSTEVLGQPVTMPVLVAPSAFHGLACAEAERATARAAARAGTILCLSTLSNTDIEAVTAAAAEHGGSVWFQLYVYRDRTVTEALVHRAEAAGCRALVLTVDAPRLGQRERDVRNGFRLPPELSVRNLGPAGLERLDGAEGASGLADYFYRLLDPSLTWDDLAWLVDRTSLPVVVKGIVRPDDAVRAVEHGAHGVLVSNHGGRQLDTAPATAEVLGPIADAVGDRAEVLVDGGIRRGTDALKALALGARAVCLGRPVLWGLAARGEDGAHHVLEILRDELDLAMALAGCPTIDAVDRSLLGARRPA